MVEQVPPSVTSTTGRVPTWQVWTALSIVYVVWGTTYLAIRVVVETVPPLLSASFRFLVAGAAYYLWLRFRDGSDAVRVSRKQLVSCAIVGTALLLGGNGLVTLAEQTVSSSLAALMIASVPLWVVLMRRVSGDRIAGSTLVGVAIGFAGVAWLVLPGGQPEESTTIGIILLIFAPMFWAAGSFLSGRIDMPANPFVSTAYQMLFGGIATTIVGGLRGEFGDIHFEEFSVPSLVALGYLVVFGSWVAFTAYVWALQNVPVSKVATYAFVNPVIAITLGWLILDEQLTPTMLGAAAIIIASVAVIVRRETGPSPQQRRVEAVPAGAVADST
ncbi:MAG: EamA family transporter [Actinobacteria bacterium]|nr:EamA family transporter [Actinomycetota bacterium]